MELQLTKTPGLRNDLLVTFSRAEVEDVLFHIANRDRLMALPGLLRHAPEQGPAERERVNDCKIPVDNHLRMLTQRGSPLLDREGKPRHRVLLIGSRNVGNNHGFVAWQSDQCPKLFHVLGEPFGYPSYSCLVKHRDGRLAIRALRFEHDRVLEGATEVADDIAWCVYGNWVLRDVRVVSIADIIDQFYDIRHVLAFERRDAQGHRIGAQLYDGYPERFRANALRAWREHGVPRNRFLHSCLGLSDDRVFILQREGTIEEVATWLREAGARDGLVLDNGASVFCWAWWPYPNGGFLFTAPDFRPNASAVIAFILSGPAATGLPGGSVSFSTL